MLITETVEMTWCNNNVKYYKNIGYIHTKNGDSFQVDIKDLSLNSRKRVSVKCDYCGLIFEKEYIHYIKSRNTIEKDCCTSCSHLKKEESFMKKYGVKSYIHTSDFNKKRDKAMIDKYGTVHALQNSDLHDKFKATCMANNNVEYPMQSNAVKEKRENNCLEKYGKRNTLEVQSVRDKIENTCMEKYGYKSTANVSWVREKQRQTLYNNGSIPSSKPERDMVNILSILYGEENCIAQFPTEYYNLDCLLTIGDIKIDVEYDGQWCHNLKFDNRRDKYHINHGYKVLRFIGNNKIPTEQQILDAVGILVNTNKTKHVVYIEK